MSARSRAAATLAALVLVLTYGTAHAATGHALVVGIGRFADPDTHPLPGTEHDIVHAKRIAAHIGIAESATRVLADEQATADAVRSRLQYIGQHAGPRDKVFVYFSTHGSRWTNWEAKECDESLVFYDGKHITKDELAALLKPIAQKAHKLLLFVDACHSGSFTASRSIAGRRLIPKFHPNPKVTDKCWKVVNDLAESISPVPPRARSVRPNNVVVVTAARVNEYALHREDIGGLATHAWLQCALGKASDSDRSGAISLAEIEACAQRGIEHELRGVAEYRPHHIVTQGVRALPFSALTQAAPELPVPPPVVFTPPYVPPVAEPSKPQTVPEPPAAIVEAPKPVTSPPAPPPPVLEVAPPAPPPATTEEPALAVAEPVSPVAALHDIVAMSDGRWDLEVDVGTPRLRIGRDLLSFRIRSEHPGFVYVLAVGSDNRTVDLLFPNRLDGRNTVRAGETLALPRASWRLRAQGPAGTNRLLVLVTETERDLRRIATEELAGVFLRARPERIGALQRGIYGGTSESGCRAVDTRNLVVEAACTPRFAARLIEVEEVAE